MRHPSKKQPILIKVQGKPLHGAPIRLPHLPPAPLSARPPNAPPGPLRDPAQPLFEVPAKPSHILLTFPGYLTEIEQSEIMQCREIYFLRRSPPKPKAAPTGVPEFFRFVQNDHIAYRYEQIRVIGKGSFGSVISCIDHKTGTHVAIKMLRDRPKVHSQIMFELELLVHLQSSNAETNIIRYIDNFTFRGFFCIVMELLYLDIYTVLKAQRFVGFPNCIVRTVAKETAESLHFIHSSGIIHCDIKPENILFTSDDKMHVKVIDFGCSCFVGKIMFSYIQSRYYRAPEVVLGLEYGREIDIWSLGCVLCEMLTGYPLFCADDETQLINMVVQLLGLPPISLVKQAPRAHHYFDEGGQLKQKAGKKGAQQGVVPGSLSLADATKIRDPVFLSLIDGCLKWLPMERLTAEQVMEHPWAKDARPLTEPATPMSAR
jgi:dual specificity tyrosine-phosphorylation-regulated kinase 2/3/4